MNINVVKSAWRRWKKAHFPTFWEIVNDWEHGIEPYGGAK